MSTLPRHLLTKSEPSAENVRCQKCLEKGHWTYQCTGKRKYVERESRTKEMKKRIKQEAEKQKAALLVKVVGTKENAKHAKKTKSKKRSDEESSDSDSDSSSDSSSSSSSSNSTSSKSGTTSSTTDSSDSSSSSSSESESDTENAAAAQASKKKKKKKKL